MSHFYTLVLLKPEQVRDDLEEAVKPLLAAYDENLEVPAYEEKCWCVGAAARKAAREIADKTCGTIADLRDKFHARADIKDLLSRQRNAYNSDATEEQKKDGVNADKEMERLWRAHIANYEGAEKAALDAHVLNDKPDPSCEDCNGTSKRSTTYNPKSQWDWYQIGGRWTGALGDYDPEKDPRNIETCDLCGGTGTRLDMKVENGCNGCGGKGTRVKWPTQWRNEGEETGNVAPAREMLRDDKRIPFAIVTPDGAWNEKGKMGWFGMTRDEKEDDDWNAQARQIIEAHADCIAVVVDCHI